MQRPVSVDPAERPDRFPAEKAIRPLAMESSQYKVPVRTTLKIRISPRPNGHGGGRGSGSAGLFFGR